MNTEAVLTEIAKETHCTSDQVRTVIGLALKWLHKIAVCDEQSVTTSAVNCHWMFGEEACYHFTGILEEARVGTDSELSWSEFLNRFAPKSKKFAPVLRGWMEERTEARKRMDERAL